MSQDIKQLIERLRAVLCDPDGVVCAKGSAGDREEIELCLEGLERLTQPVGVEPYMTSNYNGIEEAFYSAETVARLQAELAEANKAAQFNFDQYQDLGRLLAEECEKTERLRAELAEAQLEITAAITRIIIDVEKLICEKLGRKWASSGMSISTLVEELSALRLQQAAVPEFDHSIGEDRFKVVKGPFWWHVKTGDGEQRIGKFHTETGAQELALYLLTAFRDGAFMQHKAMLAAAPAAPSQPDSLFNWQNGNPVSLKQPSQQDIPRNAIEKILTEVMDAAVANGADSRSMPDEYVEVAAWLCGIKPSQPAEPVGYFCRDDNGDWEQVLSIHADDFGAVPLYTAPPSEDARGVRKDKESCNHNCNQGRNCTCQTPT